MTQMSSWDARRLVLRNDLAELQRLAGWIEGWAQRGVSADVSFAVQLCLEEAVANVIMYAGAKDSRLEIAVEVERNGATLVARIGTMAGTSIRRRCRHRPWRPRWMKQKSAMWAFISSEALPVG